MPLMVSVIMPAYNAGNFIGQAIESVQAQSYVDWELWVVNDASSDDTAQVVNTYLVDQRIHLLNVPKNQGVSAARNAGMRNAKGQLLAFLDADDCWLPEKLARQVALHESDPELGISFTRFACFNDGGESDVKSHVGLNCRSDSNNVNVSELYYRNMIGTLTVMLRKEVLDKAGLFDPGLRAAEDHDLWLRIAKAGYRFGYLDTTLARYRLSGEGLSKEMGAYKAQRRRFLKKHYALSDQSDACRKAWGGYYRHFGCEYHKRGKHVMAMVYFSRAMTCYGVSAAGLRMLFFYLRAVFKRVVGR